MRTLLSAAGPTVVGLALVLGPPDPCLAGTTIIDFETPSLGDAGFQIISPYVASDVTFTATSLTGCPRTLGLLKDSTGNQLLSTSLPGIPIPAFEIVAHFPPEPAAPVTVVRVEVRTFPVPVFLSLFGSDGRGLAGASGVGSTTLTAVASERVAGATIRTDNDEVICGTEASCEPCVAPIAIDNFTFGCVDNEAPELGVELSTPLLWPPNHELALVHASVEVQDDCDGAPSVILASIASNEPDQETSPGDLPDDIQEADLGGADFDFALRSERAEGGDGRTYTVCYRAMDASANTAQQCAQVRVPHDRRQGATKPTTGGKAE